VWFSRTCRIVVHQEVRKLSSKSLLDGAEPASPGKFRKSETWRLVLNLTGYAFIGTYVK